MSRAARIWLVVAAVGGAVVVPFVLFARTDTQSFRARSENMVPTIQINERFTANKDAYDDEAPERHDIVVIHPPANALEGACERAPATDRLCATPGERQDDVTFVKRIVGLPGDRFAMRRGRVLIDGRPLREPYVQPCEGGGAGCHFRGEIAVPADHYYVLGDNRGASDDSRFWGPIHRDQIVGRVDDCWPFGLRCSKTADPG